MDPVALSNLTPTAALVACLAVAVLYLTRKADASNAKVIDLLTVALDRNSDALERSNEVLAAVADRMANCSPTNVPIKHIHPMKKHTLPLLAIVAGLTLAGCTQTKFTGPGFSLSRTSFLQKLEVAAVEVSTNGTAKISGYQNDGGADAAAKITGAAISAAISAAKP